MKPFETFVGLVATLPYDNIDTDTIIPSREIVTPEKTGFDKKLFSAWRYLDYQYTENSNFILNQEPYREASILLAGNNFGCGSSREMAVWALMQFGFKTIIAKSFGAIFKTNCIRNGLLPIQISELTYQELLNYHSKEPKYLGVNLIQQKIEFNETPLNQKSFFFEIDPEAKEILINGEDAISKTQQYQSEIDSFIKTYHSNYPWTSTITSK